MSRSPRCASSAGIIIDAHDHDAWVERLGNTWFGDADLNGEFDSNDLVQAFQTGKYEKGWFDEWGNPQGDVAGWSEGDWDGDRLFNSDDFITAFTDGGYEQGPRTDVAAVPEPGGVVLLVIRFVLWLCGFRIHRAVS